MQRLWIALGALAGLTAVAMAALAAHGLGGLDPAALADGAERDRDAGLARAGAARLRAVGAARRDGWRTAPAAAFAAGIVLFCGGGLCGWGWPACSLAMMAPMGGTLLMVGWLLFGLSALVTTRRT